MNSQSAVIRAVSRDFERWHLHNIRALITERHQPFGAEVRIIAVMRDVQSFFDFHSRGDNQRVMISIGQFNRATNAIFWNPSFHDEHGRAERFGGREEWRRETNQSKNYRRERDNDRQPTFPGWNPDFLSFKKHARGDVSLIAPAVCRPAQERFLSHPPTARETVSRRES